jgi:PAS domain S-box-containing protein
MFSSLRGKLILIFLVVTVTSVVISSGYARVMQRQYVLEQAKVQAHEDLRLIGKDIQTILQWVLRDLFLLRDMPQIRYFLSSGAQEHKLESFQAIETAFLAVSSHHPIFHQIRLIDINGQEIVRVDSDGNEAVLVPPENLQLKGSRYYVQQAMSLKAGQIYISPMDLNIEYGKIEEPFRPVIRYATPVVDASGNTRGLIVLNVQGHALLNPLERQYDRRLHGERYFLIDSHGDYLFHPKTTKRFNRLLGKTANFTTAEPALADIIKNRTSGMIIMKSEETAKETLFAFQRIPLALKPTELFHPKSISNVESEGNNIPEETASNYWHLVSAVDDAELLVGFSAYVNAFVPFTILMICGCIIIAIFVAWSMARPVVSLAGAARKIQKGDLSARAIVYTSDEMGEFGNLFNSMAVHLETSVGQLKASETKYREIFERSQDCLFVTDTSCVITDLNPAGRVLLGLSDDEPFADLSLSCCLAAPAEDVLQPPPLIKELMTEYGYVKDLETILQRKDGEIRICRITATARKDKDGNITGYEGILRDITQIRKQQEQEKNFRQKLNEEILLAEERERKDLSRLLHEELAQNLALVHLKIEEVKDSTCDITQKPRCEIDCCQELNNTKELIELMISQVRTMIFDLYPAILDDQGLIPAIRWYASHYTDQTGIKVTIFDHIEHANLGETKRIYLYRSFKELLHNITKHAECSEVVVSINKRDNNIRLIVDDEGKGFDPQTVFAADRSHLHGIGLATIQEWMNDIGGEFIIESTSGQGTRVILDVPVTTGTEGEND